MPSPSPSGAQAPSGVGETGSTAQPVSPPPFRSPLGTRRPRCACGMMRPVPSSDEAGLAAEMAAVARALAVEPDLTAVMVRACRLAVDAVEGCEHADVMIVAPGGA